MPTNFEWAVARIQVESFFGVLLDNPPACPRELIGVEMVVQGIASLRGVEAETVREEIAQALRSGLGLDAALLRNMTSKGSA